MEPSARYDEDDDDDNDQPTDDAALAQVPYSGSPQERHDGLTVSHRFYTFLCLALIAY